MNNLWLNGLLLGRGATNLRRISSILYHPPSLFPFSYFANWLFRITFSFAACFFVSLYPSACPMLCLYLILAPATCLAGGKGDDGEYQLPPTDHTASAQAAVKKNEMSSVSPRHQQTYNYSHSQQKHKISSAVKKSFLQEMLEMQAPQNQ